MPFFKIQNYLSGKSQPRSQLGVLLAHHLSSHLPPATVFTVGRVIPETIAKLCDVLARHTSAFMETADGITHLVSPHLPVF